MTTKKEPVSLISTAKRHQPLTIKNSVYHDNKKRQQKTITVHDSTTILQKRTKVKQPSRLYYVSFNKKSNKKKLQCIIVRWLLHEKKGKAA